MIKLLQRIYKGENGIDGWIPLIIGLSFITLIIGLNFDLRHEWNKRSLFREVVLSTKEYFQEEGGVTLSLEGEIINRLSEAGLDTSNVTVEGTPQSNYGSKIYYIVTFDTNIKLGSENHGKVYKQKVVGTSNWIPES